MFGCGLLARFTRDRYNSLAAVAIVVGLLVFGLIITTIILHLAFLWLVLVSATVMLFTAFGYSTCTSKPPPHQLQEQPSVRSESVSTISDHVAETVSIEDFPPCYDVVVKEEHDISVDSKPPSYLDALALQRCWLETVATTPHLKDGNASEQHPDTPSQVGSFESFLPPPYEEYNASTYATDQHSETTISFDEDTSSLGDTSYCTVSSHSSYESLYLENTPTFYSGRGCSSQHYQANLHHGQFSDMPGITSIC